MNRGIKAYGDLQMEEAVTSLEEAIRYTPNSAKEHYYLAVVYESIGRS